VDAEDEGDHARAALREMQEEIGVAPAAVTIVEQLDMERQERNVFDVTPFVGILTPGTDLVPDGGETIAAHRIPLAAIIAPGAVHRGLHHAYGRDIETMVFDYGPLRVWGLTGNILRTFVDRWNASSSPLRAVLAERLL